MTLMPLLMIEKRARSLVDFLVDIGAVTEDAGRDILNEPRKNAADLEA